jgi:glucose/arabinose dehydrogenase
LTPDSELPLLNQIPIGIPNYNRGDLEFGKDGFLYVSTGDGGTDTPGDAEKAQDLSNLHGKILRIARDGSGLASNPIAGRGSDRCDKDSSTAPDRTCTEVFAYGLRNPYRIAFDPNARSTRFSSTTWMSKLGRKSTAAELAPTTAGPNERAFAPSVKLPDA